MKLIFVKLFSVSQNAHCDPEVEKHILFMYCVNVKELPHDVT
jgi:hypothetical protein